MPYQKQQQSASSIENMRMKNLKINELESIACIASVGKISTAATRLGTTQANLSRMLSSIESKLGLKIFNRSTRHLSLSDFGEVLLPRIQHALQANEDICNFIDSYKEKPIGNVTIAAPLGALIFLARYVIPKISDQIQGISVSLVSYTLENDQDLVMKPDWDIMLSVSMPSDDNLISRQVGTFSMGFYATPEFIAHNTINTVNDVAGSKGCILLSVLGRDQNVWSYKDPVTDEIKNIKVQGKYLCDESHYAIELARQGLGIVYTPLFLILEDINSGKLAPCLSSDFNVDFNAYLLYRNRKFQPHRVNVIIDEIVANLQNLTFPRQSNHNLY